MDSCSSGARAYKNGKTFEQCRIIAEKLSSDIAKIVDQKGLEPWSEILQTADHDELVYKLILKNLRLKGYNIGDWKTPKVTKIIS